MAHYVCVTHAAADANDPTGAARREGRATIGAWPIGESSIKEWLDEASTYSVKAR